MKSSRIVLVLLTASLATNVGLLLRSNAADRLTAENATLRTDLDRIQKEFADFKRAAAAENKRVIDEANAALTAAADKVMSDFVGK